MTENSILKLSLSQQTACKPFQFRDSKFKLYTFEELIYHMYHYSGDSIEEFTSDRLFQWIREDLQLPDQVIKIERLLNTKDSVIQSYLSFLQASDLLSTEEIYQLKQNLLLWETRTKWEKLKEKGDRALLKGELEKAASIYEEALKSIEDPLIFNNLGVAYMRLSQFTKAEVAFHEAQLREPNHLEIHLNIIELYISQNRYTLAEKFLLKAKAIDTQEQNPLIPYFAVQLERMRENRQGAYEMLAAIDLQKSPKSAFALAEMYAEDNRLDKAEEVLQKVAAENRDLDFYLLFARIYVRQDEYFKAQSLLQEGREKYPEAASLSVALAKAYQQLAEYDKASQLIEEVFAICPKDDSVRLELARLRKLNGKAIDYENILKDILVDWREKVRSSQ